MFFKEICLALLLVLLSSTMGMPTVAVDPANPLPLQPQSRTFSTLGSLFGGNYGNNYRYSEGYRGYPSYGAAYSGNAYSGNPGVAPQQVVPGYTGYGGYGWRGGSDYRGYGQSGWANRGTSGWSQNYGR